MSEEKKTNAALAEPPEGEGANVQSAVDEAGGESKEDLKGKKAPSAAVRRKKKEKTSGFAKGRSGSEKERKKGGSGGAGLHQRHL